MQQRTPGACRRCAEQEQQDPAVAPVPVQPSRGGPPDPGSPAGGWPCVTCLSTLQAPTHSCSFRGQLSLVRAAQSSAISHEALPAAAMPVSHMPGEASISAAASRLTCALRAGRQRLCRLPSGRSAQSRCLSSCMSTTRSHRQSSQPLSAICAAAGGLQGPPGLTRGRPAAAETVETGPAARARLVAEELQLARRAQPGVCEKWPGARCQALGGCCWEACSAYTPEPDA